MRTYKWIANIRKYADMRQLIFKKKVNTELKYKDKHKNIDLMNLKPIIYEYKLVSDKKVRQLVNLQFYYNYILQKNKISRSAGLF